MVSLPAKAHAYASWRINGLGTVPAIAVPPRGYVTGGQLNA